MRLEWIDGLFSICRMSDASGVRFSDEFCFFARTDGECSVVCRPQSVPGNRTAVEHGWRAFRVQGALDLSLVGILSGISGALAEAGVGLFAVSTYDTDYVLVKAENAARAEEALRARGYVFSEE